MLLILNPKVSHGAQSPGEISVKKRQRKEVPFWRLTEKLRATIRYIENNYLVGLPRSFHGILPGEKGFTLANLGAARYRHSYNPMIALMVLTLMGNRKMMLYGEPGLGKSAGALLMNKVAGVDEVSMWDGFVVGNPEQGQDMFAHPDMGKITKGQWGVQWSTFTDSPIKFFDETSRFSGYAQGLILSLLSENKAVYQSEKKDLPAGPFYFAANALNGGETFGIIPALRSRIDVATLASNRELFFSNTYQKPKAMKEYDSDFSFTTEEFQLLQRAVADVEIDATLHKYLSYFLQKVNDVPYGMMKGEDQTKSAFYGRYEQAVRAHASKLEQAEQADLQANRIFQINNGFSDRDRQALEWFAKAAAVLAHMEGTKVNFHEEYIKALFPYVAYNQITLNSLSQKANADQVVYDQMEYLKTFSSSLWEKVKKDLGTSGTANVFGRAQTATQISTMVEDYEKRWGINQQIQPAENLMVLSNRLEELLAQGLMPEAISVIVATLKDWDKKLTAKNDTYQQQMISALKMLDYVIDLLENGNGI